MDEGSGGRSTEGIDSLIELYTKHKDFRQRQLMRGVLSALADESNIEDLDRARKALDDDAVDPRDIDLEYFGKWGSFKDIPRLAKIACDYRIAPSAGLLTMHRRPFAKASKAILRLAGDRLSEIFSMDLDQNILAMTMAHVSSPAFRRLNSSVVEPLLYRDATKLRKAVSLQILRSQGRGIAKNYLDRYLQNQELRFYNVIFWLDLCRAFPMNTYRPIVHRELGKLAAEI